MPKKKTVKPKPKQAPEVIDAPPELAEAVDAVTQCMSEVTNPATEAIRHNAPPTRIEFACFACQSLHFFTSDGPKRRTCACGITYEATITPEGAFTVSPVNDESFRSRVAWKEKNR